MKLAIVVYQDLTLLDLVGFTDAIQRLKTMKFLPDLQIQYFAYRADVSDTFGFKVQVDLVQPDLSTFDLVFIPGGFGTRTLIHDATFVRWLRSAQKIPLKISVCTGSLLLGAAGFLENRKATTHFDEYNLLHQYTSEVVKADLVEDQGIVTGGAVATSILVGLHTCQILTGKTQAMEIAKRMGLPDLYENADVQIY
ncbi:MAG: DJ-1/PfpI family protein [Saprospiraceae bacterium]|nr:DJ-1/PfpI family protein [Saprospiraceae bacterium]